jgi:hypothetical protein
MTATPLLLGFFAASISFLPDVRMVPLTNPHITAHETLIAAESGADLFTGEIAA